MLVTNSTNKYNPQMETTSCFNFLGLIFWTHKIFSWNKTAKCHRVCAPAGISQPYMYVHTCMFMYIHVHTWATITKWPQDIYLYHWDVVNVRCLEEAHKNNRNSCQPIQPDGVCLMWVRAMHTSDCRPHRTCTWVVQRRRVVVRHATCSCVIMYSKFTSFTRAECNRNDYGLLTS